MRRPLTMMAVAGSLALAIALTALAGGAGHTGHSGPSATATTDLGELWAIPPVEVAAVLLLGALYAARVHRVGGISGLRRFSFYSGLALILVAVCSPLGGVAQQGLMTAHMLQHTLIGATAPLLLLLGVTREFVRDLLSPRTYGVLQRLQNPLIAFPLWALSTVVWLLPDLHHLVLETPPLWILQQVSFVVLGTLLWMPVVEVIPAPRWFSTGWKGSYMSGVWFLGLGIANVYWFSGTAFYDSHAEAALAWGVEPLEDQANAGTVMMVLHCLLAFGAITVLFFRQAREGELSQRLIEAGIDPDRVAEAIRGGTGEALARLHGVSVRTRAGID
ncbi:cytochrome c oxidase assembly protein [Miltoncostaea oceani]|uniref:cytochrome c oxidase assembly protein n=1 Tax=Miltoncostaea oceani TaxID=2843216 RepID=UPI001C3DBEB4|nr:cytochrome c oxidase assembly protein [Miltoncostaea oceani]